MPIRAMQESDLKEVRRICLTAFGAFLGIPDLEAASADREAVFTRFRADPEAALVAEMDGAIAGSNFLARWGSFGFFGPLTVKPELWNRKIGQELLGPTMEMFSGWALRETGLYTFPQSPRHIALYQKFGYRPRFLTAVMSQRILSGTAECEKFSALTPDRRAEALRACHSLTDSIFDGLDLSLEINTVDAQGLGDTVFLWGGGTLDAFAVCYCGEGTEAGAKGCYVKFGAARPGRGAEHRFDQLLDACEAFAAGRNLEKIEAGVNLERGPAYERMLVRGYRTDMQGVAMVRNGMRAWNRPDAFVMDDWR